MWGERTAQLPPGIPVNFWPPTLNNVSWSKDNIIAIGGPEHIAILVGISVEEPGLGVVSASQTKELGLLQ
jgi:hypothetical protein